MSPRGSRLQSPIIAKCLGGDFELANAVLIPGSSIGHPAEAVRRLIAEIPGYPSDRDHAGSTIEHDRKFLDQGGSAYDDNSHLEMNCPEHLRSRDHALHVHAALRIARRAQVAAQQKLGRTAQLSVLANNCDGRVSYGSHLSVLTSRRCFDDVFSRKPHLAGFLATFLVTSVPYTGQGMVGAANGQSPCDYQLSQRSDFFERLAAHDTMHARPLLNLRDESHAAEGLARHHCIFFDIVLAAIANRHRAGNMQLVLAMCEAGFTDPNLLLDDPVRSASLISRDLSLRKALPTAVRGRPMTAVEIQRAMADLAGQFVESHALEDLIPDAAETVALWRETLDLLERREIDALAGRCDNWLKYRLLERQRGRRGLTWQSPVLKAFDQKYSSLDPEEGLFFQMADDGIVVGMPTEAEISRATKDPPDDTRAYLRANLLKRFGASVHRMDWSWIDFTVPSRRRWSSIARLSMPDPCRHHRADCDALLASCQTVEDVLDAFAEELDSPPGFRAHGNPAAATPGNNGSPHP